ncbi:MAG: hypothetical protein JSU72_14455, partial [Deltaproteobacteria bacterium]
MTKNDDQELAKFFGIIEETEGSSAISHELSEDLFDDLESVGQDSGEYAPATDTPEASIELPEDLFDDLEAAELDLSEQPPVKEPLEAADGLSEE